MYPPELISELERLERAIAEANSEITALKAALAQVMTAQELANVVTRLRTNVTNLESGV